MVSLQLAGVLIAGLACGVGTFTDMRKGVIPNWITLPSLAMGLGLGWMQHSWAGMGWALVSALATAMVPLLLYRWNAMGGGDVKLFAAIGALLGVDVALQVLMVSFGAGAVFGVGLWVKNGELGARVGAMAKRFVPFVRRRVPKSGAEIAPTYIRFAPAILVGVVVAVAANLGVWWGNGQ